MDSTTHDQFKFETSNISCGWNVFGIWKVRNLSDIPPYETFFTNYGHECAYGFIPSNGCIVDPVSGGGSGKKYGVRCIADIDQYSGYEIRRLKDYIVGKVFTIDMILNFEKLTLSFIINGINYGVSHNIEKVNYRAAIIGISAFSSCREKKAKVF